MKNLLFALAILAWGTCGPGEPPADLQDPAEEYSASYAELARSVPVGADLSIYPRVTVDRNSGAWFWKSEYLVDWREARFNPDRQKVQVITPALVRLGASWSDILDPTADVYAIEPGDYRPLGVFTPGFSGTPFFRKVLVFHSGDRLLDRMHPKQRKDRGLPEVVMEAFSLETESYWLIHGVTFRGYSVSKKGVTGGAINRFLDATKYNLVDFCLIENVIGGTMINGDFNQIQRSVVWMDFCVPRTDWGGVAIGAATGEVSLNCGIVECEVINTADGSGLPWNENRDGQIDGAVIENNDFYNTRFVVEGGQLKGQSENAHDCKNRSGDPNNPIRFLRNRMHGYLVGADTCSGTGSAGELMVQHNNCAWMIIEGNVGFNCNNFLTFFHQNPKFPEVESGHFIVHNNLFSQAHEAVDTRPDSPSFGDTIPTTGLAVRCTSDDVTFTNNTFAFAARGVIAEKKGSNQSHWRCNAFVEVGDVNWNPRVSLDECSNQELAAGAGDLRIWVGRWTGPTEVVLPGVIDLSFQEPDCECNAASKF